MLARLARLAGAGAAVPRRGVTGAALPRAEGAVAARGADEFRALVVPHFDSAYNLARFLARDASAAEDIVQDALLRAFRSLGTYRGGDARAWLLAIVRNCFLDWIRKNAPASLPLERLDPGEEDLNVAVHAETPETELMRCADIEAVRERIAALPGPFRETLVLRELEDLSYKEIAAITGVPIGTVMSRLARARRLLAQELGARP